MEENEIQIARGDFTYERTEKEVLRSAMMKSSAELWARARIDFPFFSQKIIGREWASFHYEQIKLILNNRFASVELPRGHLKTSIDCIDLCTWSICRNKNFKATIVSHKLEKTQEALGAIKDILTQNEFFQQFLPPDRSMDWNMNRIDLKNHSIGEVQPFNSHIRGGAKRPNLIVCDDVLMNKDISQTQAKEIFWSDVYPVAVSPMVPTELKVVGTPMTTDDLFSDLENPESGFTFKKYPGITTDVQGKWLEPLWKERTDLEYWRKVQEQMGSLRFAREIMCNPLASGDSIFTEQDLSRRHRLEISKPRPGAIYYMGLDIALSLSRDADFTVYTIIEQDMKTNLLRMVKLERYKINDPDWIIKRINTLHSIFGFRKIVVESEGLSIGIVKDLLNHRKNPNIAPYIIPFHTKQTTKELLIAGIQTALSTGTLTLLDNDILINELRSFGKKTNIHHKETYAALGKHDDCVMSLGLALEGVNSKRGDVSLEII